MYDWAQMLIHKHASPPPLCSPFPRQMMILYDYDWASANDEIGRASIKISELPSGQQRELWLDVTSEGECT